MKDIPIPLHYQISNELRKRLQNGGWSIGELFPGDKELMQVYNVSSTTIRRAIEELVREGWLERKPGKGTFIKKDYVETLGKFSGFFDQVRERGYRPSSKLLQISEIDANEVLDSELDVFDSDRILLIEKVHYLDNNPIVLVKSFWPAEIGRNLVKYDLVNQGTYEIAQKELGIVLQEAHQYIYSTLAEKVEAHNLGIHEGDPVLMMKRIAYSQGKPVEFSINYYRADRYRYRVVLKNETINVEDSIMI